MKNSLTKLIYHSFVCKWYKMKTFRGRLSENYSHVG